MDADRYARVRELFLAVEELPSHKQRDYLESRCDDDQSLIDEVLSLLHEHNIESARLEGDSAKQPSLPSTIDVTEDRSGSLDPNSAEIDSGTAVVTPYLPPSRDPSVSDQDPARSERKFNRRKRELPSKSGTGKRERDQPNSSGSSRTQSGSSNSGGSDQVTKQGSQRTHASPRYRNETPPPRRPPSPGLWQSKAMRHRRFNSSWLWLAAILPTALIGAWTYTKVVQSIRESTAGELAGVADSVRISINRFLDDQSRLARSWSQQVNLRHAVLGLIDSAKTGSVEELRSSPHAAEIRKQLIALSEQPDIKYVVWDRTGRIVASWLKDGADIGGSVAPDGAANLARAMRGETVLFGPAVLQPEESGFNPETDLPVMAEILPIRDDADQVVATMLIRGFGMYANFDDICRQASEAGGLDVYAVNADGDMITNSPQAMERLIGRTQKTGDAESSDHPKDQLSDKETNSEVPPTFVACNLRVSDPGDSVATDRIAADLRRSQPLIYSVAGVSSGQDHAMLVPYPNYVGIPVVGAWRWINEWKIGVVVERASEEAFATARIVRYGFFSLGGILTLTALFAAGRIAKRTALAQAAVHPLSRYQVTKELGSGGMGVVYRATHSQLGRDTALKVLRADRDNLEDRLRFDREAKLAASLSSAHTVTIYDYGRGEEGEAYCVMEFLKGITLYDVVARSGFQDIGRVLFVLRQICDSLGEAHKLGLVHRDIKPQNVMLSLDPSVGDWAVVFDFGLAKPLNPDSDSYQTAETIWAGTPMYMAPERYREPNKIDPRSDIYSVGCIAYFLLSGRPPFIECDPESLFALVLTEQPISISVHRDEEIPDEVTSLVDRCMAKNVDDRVSTVDELARRLDELIPRYGWSVEQARAWWRIHGEEIS